MSNVLLINYPPPKAKDLAQFLSSRGLHCLTPVPSLDDESLSSFFQREEEAASNVDVALIDLNGAGTSDRRGTKHGKIIKKIHLFLKQISEANSTACVILTGKPIALDQVSELLRGGVYDYLESPASPKQIEKTITQGLKNREQAQDIIRSLARSNAQLVDEKDRLQTWSNDLNRIYEINQKLAASLNIDELICSFGESVKTLVPYDTLSTFLKGVEGTDRVWVWASPQQNKPAERAALLKDLHEEALQRGQKFLQSDEPPTPSISNEGAEIAIPLVLAKEKIGLLQMTRDVKRSKTASQQQETGFPLPFDDYQMRILSMLTTPLCLTIRNAQMYQQVKELAATDELTQVLNRRAFLHVLEREFKRSIRLQTPLALFLIDLDHFKQVNDFFGHLTGDVVLKETALLLKQSVREVDILARYGGEEFVVILPELNSKEALVAAERIRNIVETHTFNKPKDPIQLTVSIGLAMLPSPSAKTSEDVFHLADSALYLAKKRGRNRIEVSALNGEHIENKEGRVKAPWRRVNVFPANQ